ncbi:MAG: hypothetical protein ILP11_04855, partial [Alphaproteobacteria bacterium]|nr:hypothetical protein [Alphaproteobacteria bacterium]
GYGSTIKIICGMSILMTLVYFVLLVAQLKTMLVGFYGILQGVIIIQSILCVPVYVYINKILKKINSEENEEIERRYRAILKKNKLDEQKLLFFQREEIKDQIRKELDKR